MSGLILRRFANTALGMHAQIYDDNSGKALGVVLEPPKTHLPAGTHLARPCPAGVLIDVNGGVPLLMKDCTEPHAKSDLLVGMQIGGLEKSRAPRVIAGRAEHFDAFLAAHANQPFVLTVIDPSPEP